MSSLYSVIVLGTAVAAIVAVIYAITRSRAITALARRAGESEKQLIAAQERAVAAQQRLEETAARLDEREKEISALRNAHTQTRMELQEAITRREAEREAFETARKKLNGDFENLATRIFDESSKKFTAHNRDNISQLLTPLKQHLDDFRKRVDDVHVKESEDWAKLTEQIVSLKSLNDRISQEADNLTRALKGDKKLMGSWGEQALERILEMSGLEEGRQFERQYSDRTGDGRLGRPDVVVHMPNARDVVIDSKVSLVAYERCFAAETDEEKQEAEKKHIASIRAHIDGLSSKNYEELTGLRTLDFVLMFVPIEPAYALALKAEPGLLDYAIGKKVLLVSPTSLLSGLRTISHVWRYEMQNRNAQQIAQKAAALYDKFAGFTETLGGVQKHIHAATETCDKAVRQLSTGTGSLVKRVKDLEKLGVKGKKQMAKDLVDQAEENDAADQTALPPLIEEKTEQPSLREDTRD